MTWDTWGHIVELIGLVVTIVSLHISNLRWANKTRDEMLGRMTAMETKVDLLYGWFKRNIFKGRSTESDDRN